MAEYLAAPYPTLRQGDVLLAPSVLLLQAEGSAVVPAPPVELGKPVHSLPWRQGQSSWVPDIVAETVMTPVLVVSHDCHLEKDFNERFDALIAQGVAPDDARAAASRDPNLDPWAVVAPLEPYAAVPKHRQAGIRDGTRIGYLSLDALPHAGDDYVVDLGRVCTVSVQLLPQSAKLASLAPSSVAELRYKLAEVYAIRDLAVVSELEAMVGQRILHVEALPKSRKKTALVLHLENGELVHLEIRRPRDELPEEITRVPADPR